MKRYIRANAGGNPYEISDANKFSQFIGDVANEFDRMTHGVNGSVNGMYDIQGTQFVADYGYVYEIIVRDLDSPQGKPTEIGYITIDYTKSPGGGMYAYQGDDEDTTFAAGKSFDDILEDVAEECAHIVNYYEENSDYYT